MTLKGIKPLHLYALLLFYTTIPFSYSKNNSPDIKELPHEIAYRTQKLRYDLGDRLSNVIFDTIESLSIYTFQGPNNSSIGLRIGRNVYNNHDILQSWTVTDRFRIPISIPIYTKAFDFLDSIPLSFSIGINGELDLMNIRQVLPRKYSSLPSINDRLFEVENSLEETVTPDEDDYIIVLNENNSNSPNDPLGISKKYKDILLNDSLNNARYGNLLNMISAPLRFPIKAKLIKNLDVGEISSYRIGGALVTSLSWIPEPINITNPVKLGIGVSAYVNGNFRITIMRVAENIVRVKLTQSYGKGRGFTIGCTSNYKEHDSLDGIFFIDYLSSGSLTITPFSITSNKENSSIFNVVYEYDLSHPEGVKAYNNAVWGNFKKSGDIVQKYIEENLNNSPVIEIGSLETDGTGKSIHNNLRLGFIYKKNYALAANLEETKVFLPDGNYLILKGTTKNYKQWKSIIGSYEKIQFDFVTNVFPEKIQYADEEWLNIIAEGRIEDSHTNGKELAQYIQIVESSIGKTGIFETPPIYIPVKKPGNSTEYPNENEEDNYKLAAYGRSNFLFRIKLSQPQVEKFILTPEEDMWPILEKAFYVKEGLWSTPARRFAYQALTSGLSVLNFPLYVVDFHIRAGSNLFYARQIYKEWKKIKEYINSPEIYKALNDFFYQRRYSHELFRILIACQENDPVAYMVRGANDALGGVIWHQSSEILDINNITDEAELAINFDNPANIVINDPNAFVTNIQIQKTDDTDEWKLSFNLSKKPKFIFLQLICQHFVYQKILWEVIVKNNEAFQEGENEIIINQNSPEPLKNLINFLEPGKKYILKMGVSINGKQWGPLSSNTFNTFRK